ncbi:hypothetical protein M8C21_004672 [Ambrosia artemisiifolia]|uniref:Protein kinase domain-containing protein n=1 Tax=Ambrosia artemisiifolia TaxID=4212 RepID=A0AAD5BYC5_AMBAR|nr:hypothetical protein M8C21_004672 [Ambrosia artemisiifolia]
MDRVEDVLLHQKLLVLARDPENRLVFHVRLLENFGTRTDVDDGDHQELTEGGFEPCFKLEDLNLEVRKSGLDKDIENIEGESSRRSEEIKSKKEVDIPDVPIHEVIFSALDKPKLLSQGVYSEGMGLVVSEYMTGGSLYDYLHKNHNTLMLPQLVKFAIDVCKGMEYLHKNNIIHRDLKTANLLMDSQHNSMASLLFDDVRVIDYLPNLNHISAQVAMFNEVVKVADFGVARFLTQGGVMTAETGTYRWMAPEVINHQLYDQKADVFSFAIVLWELVTAKVPYENMTPLQAALGVRQGLRPDVPANTHPKLVKLMEKGWDSDPDKRPSFSKFKIELEGLLQEIQDSGETPNGN